MIRFAVIFTFFVGMTLSAQSFAAVQCSSIFATIDIEASIKALAKFRLDLDLAQAKGFSSSQQTALRVNYVSKEKQLIEHLTRQGAMTKAELLEKIKAEILNLQKVHKEDDKENQIKKQSQKIQDLVVQMRRKMQFNRVERGSFIMDPQGQQKQVTLTKSFEMMATPTTQIMWQVVADLYRARFPHENLAPLERNPSHRKDENSPVEFVSSQEIERWISQLNTLSKIGESELVVLNPSHQQGDVYRLPTEAEWEFVARGRGQFNEAYHFGNDVKQLTDHAWIWENSNIQSHPVGEKKPLIFDNQKFYDMHGNIAEMVADRYTKNLPGGLDPVVKPYDDLYLQVTRGGSWSSSDKEPRLDHRAHLQSVQKSESVGFRLLREVRP